MKTTASASVRLVKTAHVHHCAQPPRRPREFSKDVSAGRAHSILTVGSRWVVGTVITYYCYQAGDTAPSAWHGNAIDRKEVDAAFQKWFSLGIGISFRAVSSANEAMVRIGFDQADGSWSNVGRDILTVRDPAEPTMNFGWPLNSPYGQDTALHEIGHTLGLEHEHQNPFAGILWNEPAVRAAFRKGPNFWNDDQINHNILDKIPANSVKGTNWDPDSVMEYQFEAGLIQLPKPYDKGLKPKGSLSPLDKAWVRESYPVPAAQVSSLNVALSQKLDIGIGETRLFEFKPQRTRTYKIGTFGDSDTVLVLFEVTPAGNVQIAGDDDTGENRNALISMRLRLERTYQVGVRLYHADSASETSLMVW